jgi:diguanylate cyclase (GGDEF)-like protein
MGTTSKTTPAGSSGVQSGPPVPGWRLWGIPLLVFAITALLGLSMAHFFDRQWHLERYRTLEEIGRSQAAAIERRLSRSMLAAPMLGYEVSLRKGELERFPFEQYAQHLLDNIGGISNLQLAQDGIIRRIYPLEGNERALGLDVFAVDSGDETRQAISSRQLTVIGPIELAQGGRGILGRYPVFLSQNHKDRFWGVTSAMVTLEDFLALTDLPALPEKGYRYRLWHRRPGSDERDVFAGANATRLSPPVVTTPIHLPNKTWYLDIAFRRPAAHGPSYLTDTGLALVIAALVAVLVYLVLRLPERLRSEIRAKSREIETAAFFDSLTGLPNRRLFLDRLSQAIRHQQRSRPFALLFLDLDNFKRINETLGHRAGDLVLSRVAEHLSGNLRVGDTVARIDGDEFAIILRDVDNHADVSQLVRKLIAVANTPVTFDRRTIATTASAGVTLCPEDGADSNQLTRNAELALYHAKKQGKNCFQYFRAELNAEAARRLDLEADLRRALVERQFILHYQPIIDLANGRVVALEALVRWQHPERGLVPPSAFIPVAEESGLIIEIGETVVSRACHEIQQLNRDHDNPLKVNVNLSPRQFRHPGLADAVANALQVSNLPPDRLELEIIESTLMDDIAASVTTLNQLKEKGTTVSIDDFGTGYSSLNLLKKLPVDTLKIDREFVRDIPDDRDDREIVSAIIVMAHKLGLSVVAEGVETEAQLDFLAGNNCDHGQGFLFSRPVPADGLREAIVILERQWTRIGRPA